MAIYAFITITEGDEPRRACTEANINGYLSSGICVYSSYNKRHQGYADNFNGIQQYSWTSIHKESSGIARFEAMNFIKNNPNFNDNDIFIISDDRRELVNDSGENTIDVIIKNLKKADFCYTKSSDARSLKGKLKNWGQIYITKKKEISIFLNNLTDAELNAIKAPFMEDYAMLKILLKQNKRLRCIQKFKRLNRYKGKSIARYIPNNLSIKNWYTQEQWKFIKAAVSIINIKKIKKYQKKTLFKIELPDNSEIKINSGIKKTNWNKKIKTGFEKHFKIINYIMSLDKNKENLINATVKKRFPRYGRGLWTGNVSRIISTGLFVIKWEDGTETNMTKSAVQKCLIK